MPCSQVYSYLSVLRSVHVLKCTYQYVLSTLSTRTCTEYREYTRVGTGFRGSSEF